MSGVPFSVYRGRYPALDVLLARMSPDQVREFDRFAGLWGQFKAVNREAKAYVLDSGRVPDTWLLPAYLNFYDWAWWLLSNTRGGEISGWFTVNLNSGLDEFRLRNLLLLLGVSV